MLDLDSECLCITIILNTDAMDIRTMKKSSGRPRSEKTVHHELTYK